jgi:hypothetical protein
MPASDGYLIAIYVIYAAVSIRLIIWLGRTLFRNGAVFLEDVFPNHPDLAQAVNKLLVTGFYMLNLGFALLLMQGSTAPDAVRAVEVLVRKLATLLVLLGCLHLVNMLVFHRIRRRAQLGRPTPPLPPASPWAPQPAGGRAGWPLPEAATSIQPPAPLDPPPARPLGWPPAPSA